MNTSFKNNQEDIMNYLMGHKHDILNALIVAYKETGLNHYKESAKTLNKMLSDTRQNHYIDINRELEGYSWRKAAKGAKENE